MNRNLKQLRQALKDGKEHENNAIIVMGAPKSGKSALASTIAKAPQIKQVYYFDLEKSLTTILHAPDSPDMVKANRALTDEEMEKIIPIRINDTMEIPRASEVILKAFTAAAERPVIIDLEEGRLVKKEGPNTIPFSLRALGTDSAVILDSGSQLADSILNLAMLQAPDTNLVQLYGTANLHLNSVMSAIQGARCTVIVVTHLLDIDKPPKKLNGDPILVEIAPLLGSRNYSKNKGGKYFSWSIMCEERNGKYLVGSSPTFKAKAKLGNRFDKKIEEYPDFDMSWIFLDPAKWPESVQASKPHINIAKRKV